MDRPRVLVSGGGSRLGSVFVRGLLAWGYDVVVHHRGAESLARDAIASIDLGGLPGVSLRRPPLGGGSPVRASSMGGASSAGVAWGSGSIVGYEQADFTDALSVDRFTERLRSYPACDLVVHNASVFVPDGCLSLDRLVCDRHFAANFHVPVGLTRALAESASRAGLGRVVVVCIVDVMSESFLSSSAMQFYSYHLSKLLLGRFVRSLPYCALSSGGDGSSSSAGGVSDSADLGVSDSGGWDAGAGLQGRDLAFLSYGLSLGFVLPTVRQGVDSATRMHVSSPLCLGGDYSAILSGMAFLLSGVATSGFVLSVDGGLHLRAVL